MKRGDGRDEQQDKHQYQYGIGVGGGEKVRRSGGKSKKGLYPCILPCQRGDRGNARINCVCQHLGATGGVKKRRSGCKRHW